MHFRILQTLLLLAYLAHQLPSLALPAIQYSDSLTNPDLKLDDVPVGQGLLRGAEDMVTSTGLPQNVVESSNKTQIPDTTKPSNNSTGVGLVFPMVVSLKANASCSEAKNSKFLCKFEMRTLAGDYRLTLDLDNPSNGSLEVASKIKPDQARPNWSVDYQESRGIKRKMAMEFAKTLANFVLNIRPADRNTGRPCHYKQTRAFERFWFRNERYYVGVTQTSLCFAAYRKIQRNETQPDRHDMNYERTTVEAYELVPMRFVKQGPRDEAPMYRYNSLTVVIPANQEHLRLILVDEGGRISQIPFSLERQGKSLLVNPVENPKPWSYSLSTIASEVKYTETLESLPFFEKSLRNSMVKQINELDPKTSGVKRLGQHVELSFIESAIRINGAFCWSTGLRVHSHPSVKCLGGGNKMRLPAALMQKDQSKYTVFAMEVYQLEEYVHYHMIYSQFTEDSKVVEFDRNPAYWWCKIRGNLNDQAYKGPNFPDNENCTVNRILMAPVDLVLWEPEKCEKHLIAFYEHWYQMHPANNSLFEQAYSRVFEWGSFPINAITVQTKTKTFYFFLTGNSLIAVKYAEPTNDAGCSTLVLLDNTRVELQSSELIRQFGFAHGGRTYEKRSLSDFDFNPGPPAFTGYSEFVDGSWYPDIKEPPVPIPQDFQLRGTDDIKKRSDNSSASTLFIVLVVIVLGLLCCLLYYFFFGRGNPSEPGVLPASRLTSRKSKTKSSGKKEARRNQLMATTIRSDIEKQRSSESPNEKTGTPFIGSATKSVKMSSSPSDTPIRSAKSVRSSSPSKSPLETNNSSNPRPKSRMSSAKSLARTKSKASDARLKSKSSKKLQSPGSRPQPTNIRRLDV